MARLLPYFSKVYQVQAIVLCRKTLLCFSVMSASCWTRAFGTGRRFSAMWVEKREALWVGFALPLYVVSRKCLWTTTTFVKVSLHYSSLTLFGTFVMSDFWRIELISPYACSYLYNLESVGYNVFFIGSHLWMKKSLPFICNRRIKWCRCWYLLSKNIHTSTYDHRNTWIDFQLLLNMPLFDSLSLFPDTSSDSGPPANPVLGGISPPSLTGISFLYKYLYIEYLHKYIHS